MQGIPTLYRSIRFRSRLEATWARFFDRLGWRWQYEPFDLPGWIPDFVIHGADDVLVEVKPIGSFDEAVAEKIQAAAREYGWRGELLLVGTGPFDNDIMHDLGTWPCIGWSGTRSGGQWHFERAPFVLWRGSKSKVKNPHRRIGFCPLDTPGRDRITGCDGGRFDPAQHVDRKVWSAWAQAKNDSQWSAA